MDIQDPKTATQTLKWAQFAYQLWIKDQQFILELRFTLKDERNYLNRFLSSNDFKITRAGTNDSVYAIYLDSNGNLCHTCLSYSKIQELAYLVRNKILEELDDRKN